MGSGGLLTVFELTGLLLQAFFDEALLRPTTLTGYELSAGHEVLIPLRACCRAGCFRMHKYRPLPGWGLEWGWVSQVVVASCHLAPCTGRSPLGIETTHDDWFSGHSWVSIVSLWFARCGDRGFARGGNRGSCS